MTIDSNIHKVKLLRIFILTLWVSYIGNLDKTVEYPVLEFCKNFS